MNSPSIDRRVNVLFTTSKHWKDYDVFSRQKMSTFKSSRPAVLELAAKYKELIEQLEKGKPAADKSPEELEEAEKLLFMEMCEICLWGNATDLSLLTSLSYEDIQKLQGAEARKASEKNIIVNELPSAFAVLNEARKNNKDGDRRVDIVLDNAGFELFVDLILAGYLLSAGLATEIVLHPKSIPWFVSDVIPMDFAHLLNALADPQSLYSSTDDGPSDKPPQPLSEKEVGELRFLFEQWSKFHEDGKLIMRPNRFWTAGGGYWRLPATAPELFSDLKSSELVLFKGDLNYRKLTCDVSSHLFPLPLSDLLYEAILIRPSPGPLAHHNPVHNRHRPPRPRLRHANPCLPNLQSRRRSRPPRRRRRASPPNRRRRRRFRDAQMDMEW